MMRNRAKGCWLGFLLLLLGCGGDDPTVVGEAAFVGPLGGSVGFEDLRLVYPQGAVSETLILRLRRFEGEMSLPSNVTSRASPLYEVRLEKLNPLLTPPTAFQKPVTLSLPVPADLPADQVGRLTWLFSSDGARLQALGGAVREGRVEVATTNLGWFALGVRAATTTGGTGGGG